MTELSRPGKSRASVAMSLVSQKLPTSPIGPEEGKAPESEGLQGFSHGGPPRSSSQVLCSENVKASLWQLLLFQEDLQLCFPIPREGQPAGGNHLLATTIPLEVLLKPGLSTRRVALECWSRGFPDGPVAELLSSQCRESWGSNPWSGN